MNVFDTQVHFIFFLIRKFIVTRKQLIHFLLILLATVVSKILIIHLLPWLLATVDGGSLDVSGSDI